MSFTQNNNNNNLMGFSVHQPAVGAALQFFPPMGSKELDEMIDAYVPGNASILDKRTVVTCEFVQHSIATGELFKFFMVYPSNASDSFESPSSFLDSGYGSFNTSPVISEGQRSSASSSSSSKASFASKKSTAADFSHLPGMKIMTREGVDITNSASRGCKTKEQRDHAHLMRIIKACESCRKKKIRCDPSHKKRTSQSQSPEPKTSKKARKSSSVSPKAATPQMPASSQSASFAPMPFAGSQDPPAEANNLSQWDMPSFDSFVPADEVDIFAEMEGWDQFINYGDESAAVQNDWDFNADPFSPTTTLTNSTSPSQPRTPATRGLSSGGFGLVSAGDFTANSDTDYAGAFASGESAPVLPYLNPGDVERGGNYIDFNLYSPGSSYDEDLGFCKDVAAASPRQESLKRSDLDGYGERVEIDRSYDRSSEHRHNVVSDVSQTDYGQAQQPVRLRQSHAIADHRQAIGASNEAAIIASSGLHDRPRSRSQLGEVAVQHTGLAKPNNERGFTDEQPQPLISPHEPIARRRPRGSPEEESRSTSLIQTSEGIPDNPLSRVSRSRSPTSVETLIASGYVSLDAARAPKQLKNMRSLSSTIDAVDKQFYVRDDRQPVRIGRQSQNSVTAPDQSVATSEIRSALGARTTAMSQSRTNPSKKLVTAIHSTMPLAGVGRSPTSSTQTQLSKTGEKRSRYRSTRSVSDLRDALDSSSCATNSRSSKMTGVTATIGLTTVTSDAMQSVRASLDVTLREPLRITSLSAAALLWPMPRCHAYSKAVRHLQPDRSNLVVPSRLPQTLAAICCLAVPVIITGATSLLHVIAAISLLAAAFAEPTLRQTSSSCADKLRPFAQPPSSPMKIHIPAFDVDLGAEARGVAQKFSWLHSNMHRVLLSQPSPRIGHDVFRHRLVLT